MGDTRGERTLSNSWLHMHLLMGTVLLMRKFPSSNTALLGMICLAFYKQIQIPKALSCVCVCAVGRLQWLHRSVSMCCVSRCRRYLGCCDETLHDLEPPADGMRDAHEDMEYDSPDFSLISHRSSKGHNMKSSQHRL